MITEEEQADEFPTHEQSPFDQALQQQHQFYISEATRIKREQPERYAGHSLSQRILDMGLISSPENRSAGLPVAGNSVNEMPPPRFSLSHQPTQLRTQGKPKSEPQSDLLDYHQIWMNSNIATAVMQTESCQILKGNVRFMKYNEYNEEIME